jgi:hypothetical protein
MFQTKVLEEIKTHILCSIKFCRKSCRLWDNTENTVEPDRPLMTIRHMRFACWITKATDTQSEYLILIAFPRQQWSRERASMLRCTYFVSLVCIEFSTAGMDFYKCFVISTLLNVFWCLSVSIILNPNRPMSLIWETSNRCVDTKFSALVIGSCRFWHLQGEGQFC